MTRETPVDGRRTKMIIPLGDEGNISPRWSLLSNYGEEIESLSNDSVQTVEDHVRFHPK